MQHLRRPLLILIVVWGVITCLPWGAPSLEFDADSAWQFQLAQTWRSDAVFGRDVVWTYGPWGFALLRQAHPNTFWWMITVRCALVLAAMAGTFAVIRRSTKNPWAPLLVLFLGVCSLSLTDNTDYLGFLTAVLAAVLGVDLVADALKRRETGNASAANAAGASPSRYAMVCLHALAACGGLYAVAKFTFFPVFSMIFTALAIVAARVDRRVASVAGTYIVSALLLWLAAGQPLSALPDYLLTSLEVSRAFTEGMGAPMLLSHALLFAGVLITSFAMHAASLRESLRRASAWICLAAFAGVIFVIFKSACVRHQGANCFMILVALPVIVCARPFATGSRVFRCVAIATVIVGAITAELVAKQRLERSAFGILTMNLVSPARPVRAVWVALTDPGSISRRNDEAIKRLRSHFPSDVSVSGGVDIFPYENPVPTAIGFDYRPRPVLQSYQACSVKLNAIDAAYFESSRAPDWVLYRIPTSNGEPALIDARFPTLEEPLVLESLLRNYTRVSVFPPAYTVLRRSPGAREIVASTPSRESVRLGDWLDLPDGLSSQRVRCRIAFTHSGTGKLVGVLWHYPVMKLHVKLMDGSVREFRLTQELAAYGFILSPLPRSAEDLFGLVGDNWTAGREARRVKAIRVSPANDKADAWAFDSEVRVECEALQFIGRGVPQTSPAAKPAER